MSKQSAREIYFSINPDYNCTFQRVVKYTLKVLRTSYANTDDILYKMAPVYWTGFCLHGMFSWPRGMLPSCLDTIIDIKSNPDEENIETCKVPPAILSVSTLRYPETVPHRYMSLLHRIESKTNVRANIRQWCQRF